MLLVEDVLSITVLPVGEALLVVTSALDWCVLILEALAFRLTTGTLLALEDFLHGGLKLHFVGVDNFSLFF